MSEEKKQTLKQQIEDQNQFLNYVYAKLKEHESNIALLVENLKIQMELSKLQDKRVDIVVEQQNSLWKTINGQGSVQPKKCEATLYE
jgi:regulator of replication initiation timing